MNFKTITLLITLCGICLGTVSSANSLLVDDFSIPQQGILADRIVEFDLLEDPRLFGGGREIWGGPDDPPTAFGAKVEDGLLQLNTTPDGIGSGNVAWPSAPSAGGNPILDLSGYRFVEVRVEELVGEVSARVGIQRTATSSTLINILDIDEARRLRFELPDGVDYSEVELLNISVELERREYISIGSVWLVVPEPSSLLLFSICGCFSSMRRRSF